MDYYCLNRNNNQIAKETQFHNSTTNLINDRDAYVEEVVLDDTNEGDHEFIDDIKVKKKRAAGQYQRHQRHNETLQQIDDDSMRRHEIDRGSDIEYDKHSILKRQIAEENVNDDGAGSDVGGRIDNRDQLYIKDGNAEILRLVTRGRNEENNDNIYVNVPHPNNPQYIMVDNGGKEILMRRFIEEQTNGKQIIREHYQIIPGVHQQHQLMPNEVQQSNSLNVNGLYTTKSSQIGSAIYADLNNTEHKRHTDIQVDTQMQNANSSQSLVQQELENSLKQQNALLRQILLDKEKMEEKYSQQETAMETQSLPGHSLAIATQTDCEAGTQTEPYNIKPKPRRARSENDDSMSEEDYEYVRYSPPNSPNGVYWIKRKRHKKRSRNKTMGKSGRRIVMVEDIKRKIRTPIKEESEDQPAQTPPKRHVTETKTSVMRQNKARGSSNHSSTAKNSAGVLNKEVLMEISDSLDDERASPVVEDRRRHKSHHTKQIEYYMESDDESDNDIVVRRNTYSADSLDDYSGSEDLDATPYRSKSRISKQSSRHASSNEDIHYRKRDTYNRNRSESVISIPIMRPRLSRRDNIEANKKSRRQTASEPPHRSGKGPAPKPPPPQIQNKKIPVRRKAHSEADIGRKMSDESHEKSVPKYMEWYYNKSDSTATKVDKKRSEKSGVSGGSKKTIGATEKRIKARAPRAMSEKHRDDHIKLKPEPLPRTTSNATISSNDGQRMLREDLQMNKQLEPKNQTDTNHPLLQYSEHRYEHDYDPAPDIPVAPTKLPHYMYPETPPQATNKQKGNKLHAKLNMPKPSPIRENEVKDFKVIIPIKSHSTNISVTTKQLNVATLEDDHDSGIAMNSLLHNIGRRNPIADKKSVFTIAYDDVKVKRIPSESDSPQFS